MFSGVDHCLTLGNNNHGMLMSYIRVVKQLKTYDLRKLENSRKTSNFIQLLVLSLPPKIKIFSLLEKISFKIEIELSP